MPAGKPAGVRCIQLDQDNTCKLFGSLERPKLCEQFLADKTVCGNHSAEALQLITLLEQATTQVDNQSNIIL